MLFLRRLSLSQISSVERLFTLKIILDIFKFVLYPWKKPISSTVRRHKLNTAQYHRQVFEYSGHPENEAEAFANPQKKLARQKDK